MNPGLLYLLRKDLTGTLRNLRRRLRGVKGVLVAVVVALFLAPMLGSQFFAAVEGGAAARALSKAEHYRTWGPVALLGFVLLTGLSTSSLSFKAPEVGFLFPAPVSRRQLVLYNALSRMKVQVLSALWCFLFLLPHAKRWYAALIGLLLAMIFLQLVAQCVGLFFSALSEALGKVLKRATLAVLVLLAVIGFFVARGSVPGEASGLELARAFVELPAVRAISRGPRPFVEVFLADSPGVCLAWTAGGLGILGGLVVLLVVFDVAYTDRALAASRRLQRRLRRLHSGGGACAASPRKGRFVVPRFPHLAGAGPLAWRQCVELNRNLRTVLFMGLLVFMPVILALLLRGAGAPRDAPGGFGVAMVLMLSLMFNQNVLFDFRRDLDRMSYLKTLPLSPRVIACGQLFTLTLLLVLVQVTALGALALVTGEPRGAILAGLLIVLPPLDWIVTAIDNAIFLYFPYRLAPKDPGQFHFMGRLMLVLFLKFVVMGVVGACGFLVALLAWWATAESLAAAALSLATFLAALCLPATLVVAGAFRRFDVSRDLPE